MRRVLAPLASSREGAFALALALFAALRVLVFALAFPFFSNVDEYRHVDVVLKYSRGHWPAPGPDHYEADLGRWIGLYGSPEYHRDPVNPPRPEVPAPSWIDPEVGERRVRTNTAYLESRFSLEADQPPVYYAAAGAWLQVGRALGLRGAALLYWVRSLGAWAAFGLVVAAWLGLRELYPTSAFVRVGVPALLACFPHDCVQYVTSDAFSPLLGGVGFVAALAWLRRPDAGPLATLATGLALAAASLAKYPNVAIFAGVGFAAALTWTRVDVRAPVRRRALVCAAALLPMSLWILHQWLGGGGLTGTAFKVERLGWGRKSLGELWDHPLWSPSGAWTFLSGLAPSFWRGELVWYREVLAWPPADAVYTVTSAVFLALAALGLRRAGRPDGARLAEAAAGVAVLAAVGVLALLSLLFVFGEHTHPSAAFPYFVNGRLVSGVTLPFALLYVRGVEEGAARLPVRWRATAAAGLLAAVCALALGSEAALSREVFLSAYNAYHLP